MPPIIWELAFLISVYLITHIVPISHSSKCGELDLHTQTSPCINQQPRWVFRVPTTEKGCNLTQASLPKLSTKCFDKPCQPGKVLNVETGNCDVCQAGTYSNGEYLLFEEWQDIPKEFTVDKTFDYNNVYDNCTQSFWTAQGKYLLGKATAGCAITLSLKLLNLNEGQVSFAYGVEALGTLALFMVRNDRCSQHPGSSLFLHYTGPSTYADITVPLPKGENILQWYLFCDNQPFRSRTPNDVEASLLRLARVNVSGTPPLYHCRPCPSGTYTAEPNAVSCRSCPANTYANSTACLPCSPNEYSILGSKNCKRREDCTEDDYMDYWLPCDANEQTSRHWKWIEPMICNNLTGVSLPPIEPTVNCYPCPVGTELDDSGSCLQCKEGHISDPAKGVPCGACPADRVPVFGISYYTWSRMPPFVKTHCSDAFGVTCKSSWLLAGDYVTAGPGQLDSELSHLELALDSGFIPANQVFIDVANIVLVPTVPDTYLQFEFEIACDNGCSLLLKKTDGDGQAYSVMEWVGKQPRQNYTLTIKDSRPTKFTLTFQTSNTSTHDGTTLSQRKTGVVRVYRLEVTNLAKSSAVACRNCLNGIEHGRCIACPPGLFYHDIVNATSHETTRECSPCPAGSIAVADAHEARSVAEACVPCEPGTRPVNGSICVVDSNPTTRTGISYNLSRLLDSEQFVDGVELFTPSGTPYYHRFRLTLGYGKVVKCIGDWTDGTQDKAIVQSSICRYTAVRLSPHSKQLVQTKPLSLGDRLVKAIPSNYTQQFWQEINGNLTRAGWKVDDTGGDLHYLYETYEATRSCLYGRTSIVTLRCDKFHRSNVNSKRVLPETANDFVGVLETPPKCPDGTCDGCIFHFLWTSPLACRICNSTDFLRFPGECKNGKQTYYLQPGIDCVVSDGRSEVTEVLPCPYLTRAQFAAIILVIIVIVILSLTVCVCHLRNKRLEYKYMKLVQITEGAQARPNSCALEELGGVDNVDGFGRRALPHQRQQSPIPLRPSRLAGDFRLTSQWPAASGLMRMQLPKLGPVVFKSRTNPEGQTLPDNEIVG